MKSWIALLVLLVGAASMAAGQEERIWIVNNAGLPDCPEIQGVFIGFLIAEQGLLLISPQPFPGARRVGELRGTTLSFSIDPVGQFDLATTLSYEDPVAVWGTLDRVVGVGNRTGCLAFDWARFTDIDDLRTYLMWLLDRYSEVTPPEVTGGWAMRFSKRMINLRVQPDGYGSAEIRVKEGGREELRLRDHPGRFAFLPVIYDEKTGRVAIRVYGVEPTDSERKIFTALEMVEASYDAPAVTATDPNLTIWVEAIEVN